MTYFETLFYPLLQQSWKGGILVSPCPSVCLWTELCPLCIFNNTHQIHFIFTHLIKQLSHVKICNFDFVFWLGIQYDSIQSTPVISRQLGAKIRERELSGSPVISRLCARATISDLLDYRPTSSRWRLPNSMLSDNRGILLYLRFPGLYTHRHRTSVKSQQATLNFNNHATKLSNCTLCKATYDAFRAEIIQTTSHFDRKQKCLRACATGFTKVVWVSRLQIRESHFK